MKLHLPESEESLADSEEHLVKQIIDEIFYFFLRKFSSFFAILIFH